MLIVETPVFAKRVDALLADEDFRRLQIALCLRPDQGLLVPGGGGLRKIRWVQRGKGKRGGVRILYYWDPGEDTVYMLFAYSKSECEDLTQAQIRDLAKLIKEELR